MINMVISINLKQVTFSEEEKTIISINELLSESSSKHKIQMNRKLLRQSNQGPYLLQPLVPDAGDIFDILFKVKRTGFPLVDDLLRSHLADAGQGH